VTTRKASVTESDPYESHPEEDFTSGTRHSGTLSRRVAESLTHRRGGVFEADLLSFDLVQQNKRIGESAPGLGGLLCDPLC
jgi:hypothetical protein